MQYKKTQWNDFSTSILRTKDLHIPGMVERAGMLNYKYMGNKITRLIRCRLSS